MVFKCRWLIYFWMVTVFLMGVRFMGTALMGGVPMPMETHGEVLYEFPAECWAAIYMAFPLIVSLGLRYGSARIVVIGALIGMSVNVLFSVAASKAEFGYLLEAGSARDAMMYAGLIIGIWWGERV